MPEKKTGLRILAQKVPRVKVTTLGESRGTGTKRTYNGLDREVGDG